MPALLNGDSEALFAAVLLSLVWATFFFATLITRFARDLVLVLEAVTVAVIVLLVFTEHPTMLPALVVSPLVVGLWKGARGAVLVLALELGAIVLRAIQAGEDADPDVAAAITLWFTAGVGLAMIAIFVHRTSRARDQTLHSYAEARRLLTSVLDLSDELSAGLDPVPMAEHLQGRAIDEIPGCIAAAVSVPVGDQFSPVVDSPATDHSAARQQQLRAAWESKAPVLEGAHFAFALRTDTGPVAVLHGIVRPGSSGVRQALASMELAEATVGLDSALTFARLRERATADERQRLAREVHDGIAQEVATLGYLVDALAARTSDPEQEQGLRSLRQSISRVVGEIRRTVYDLRSENAPPATLGEQLQRLAAHLRATTPLEVTMEIRERVQLDDDVAHHLLRIAQEATHNAVKHARASRLLLEFASSPDGFFLQVSDDGVGLQEAAGDSQGMTIMAERARRIGAELTVRNDGGVTIEVRKQ
ncbi:sensor histidine kinase [Nocardioides limicola]|uniref:sensor histidine kinase n=1 Tax=Nocardioides limicola TaxID=2803368 RepID=UPI00193B05F8|nr:histidine kinase [Nocardioides sp. DJM-14]